MSVTVGAVTAAVAVAIFVLVLGIALWAVHRQRRDFPDGFDRTGWSPVRGHASWFRTKFTWLSGGRG